MSIFEKLIKVVSDAGSELTEVPDIKFQIPDPFSGSSRASDVIQSPDGQKFFSQVGIEGSHASAVLEAILENDDLPDSLKNELPIKGELERAAAKRIAEQSPLSPDEAVRVASLISSGEAVHDLFLSFNLIANLIAKPERFSNLDDSAKEFFIVVVKIPGALREDLQPEAAFELFAGQIASVREGSQKSPDVFNNTLRTLFSPAEVSDSVRAVHALLAPENESLRLALIVYARMNGVNLNQEDIDKARETVLDVDDPDLGGLLVYALKPENAKRLAAGVG